MKVYRHVARSLGAALLHHSFSTPLCLSISFSLFFFFPRHLPPTSNSLPLYHIPSSINKQIVSRSALKHYHKTLQGNARDEKVILPLPWCPSCMNRVLPRRSNRVPANILSLSRRILVNPRRVPSVMPLEAIANTIDSQVVNRSSSFAKRIPCYKVSGLVYVRELVSQLPLE